jgi:hypothetical protein
MRWKNEIARAEHFSLATDPWDKGVLEFVESLATWLENGEDYWSYRPENHLGFNLQPDQFGQGLVILFSEWDENSESLILADMSGLERSLLAFHMQLYIDFHQRVAANTPHERDADAPVEAPDQQ